MSATSSHTSKINGAAAACVLVATTIAAHDPAVAAPCTPEFSADMTESRSLTFDPLNDTPRIDHRLGLRNGQDTECIARLSFRLERFSQNWGPDTFLVVRNAAGEELLRVKPGSPHDDSAKITRTVPPDSTETHDLRIFMETSGEFLQDGKFEALLNIRLWAEDRAIGQPVADHGVRLQFHAQPSVRIALSEQTPDRTVSLGKLMPGASETFGIIVTSTGAYTMTVSSKNDWKLRRTGNLKSSHDAVPYHISVNGEPAPVGQAFTTHNETDHTGTQAHTFEARVGEFDFVRHGTYRDIVTVTVSAQL